MHRTNQIIFAVLIVTLLCFLAHLLMNHVAVLAAEKVVQVFDWQLSKFLQAIEML